MTIAENFSQIRAQIDAAAVRAGRNTGDVTLVAVSKNVEAPRIEEALRCNQTVFAENYVQEAKAKWGDLRSRYTSIELQLVGHLQTNKADDAVELFDVIASLDRPKLVDAIAKAQAKLGKRVRCLIEVNIGNEPQKAGCPAGDVPALLIYAQTQKVNVTGLMCIPPAGEPPAAYFERMKKLADELGLPVRSMGMSADFEQAIAAGATHVRIGTALFGARP
jgi:pyridoxal phosphate enzyme (YggS family)